MYTKFAFLLLTANAMAASLLNFPDTVVSEYEDFSEKELMESILQVSPLELENPMINYQKYSYTINNEHVCEKDVFVLALVKSTPERFMERKAIRDTWASVKSHNGANIVTVFIMGKYQNTNDNLEKKLKKENNEFGDIIQGNFIDHIRNQTYKSIMGLTWAKTFCDNLNYLLITTDETMVDTFHLTDFLKSQQQFKFDNFLYCSTFFDIGPVRMPADKSFVTMIEYPYEKYPQHCEDFAYIVSNDVLTKLLGAAKYVAHFWLENVYVTGMLAGKAEVNLTDMADEHGYNLMQPEHLKNDIDNSMFLLAKYRTLRKNWDTAWEIIQDRHMN